MKHSGPWSLEEIHRYLESSVLPIRLGCRSASGHPVVLSLWYVWREGALWCATSATARVVSMLEADPRCGFEVAGDEPPYRGVRGQAMASVDRNRGDEMLELLVDRYLGTRDTAFARWLLERSTPEVAIRIRPSRLTSWDFTGRMAAK